MSNEYYDEKEISSSGFEKNSDNTDHNNDFDDSRSSRQKRHSSPRNRNMDNDIMNSSRNHLILLH